MTNHTIHQTTCRNCGGPVVKAGRVVCSTSCRAVLGNRARRALADDARKHRQIVAQAPDVNAALQAAVDRETAPPWVRHPVPWDNVVRRPAAAVRP